MKINKLQEDVIMMHHRKETKYEKGEQVKTLTDFFGFVGFGHPVFLINTLKYQQDFYTMRIGMLKKYIEKGQVFKGEVSLD